MNKDNNSLVKNSIAKKLTIRLAILLFAVLLIIMVSTFLAVDNLISDEAYTNNRAVAYYVCDLACLDAEEENRPVDERSIEKIKVLSDYACNWSRVDYVLTFKITDNDSQIQYLGFANKEGNEYADSKYKELVGKTISFTPTEDEKLLLNSKEQYPEAETSYFSNSKEAAAIAKDGYGNKMVTVVGISLSTLRLSTATHFIVPGLILLGAFIGLMIIMYQLIRRNVFVPAQRISESLGNFIKNGEKTNIRLNESGDDEFALISSSFNKMTDDINLYLKNISNLTSVQEHQKAELEIASSIQQGFLAPQRFVSDNFEISAVMTPAKNVGGDFYDYLKLDDGRVYISIADVSGKGVPAAMFMAVTLTLMHQYARMNCSPAEIFKNVNDILVDNNPNMLFITAFAGIYDPETGVFTYSNAGHLPPYILREKPELLDVDENIMLGLFRDEVFSENNVKLEAGDIMFIYTDGVTECVDENRRFFGNDGLKEKLNDFRASHEENVVEYIDRALEGYMMNAEQHDDITMLSCTIKNKKLLDLEPDEKEFGKIKKVILESPLPGPLQRSICVAAEELFLNICSYAFEGRAPEDEKTVRFTFEHSDRIVMRFEDNGMKYDPTEEVELDVDYDPDSQLGGLGKVLIFNIADDVSYEYKDNKNILTITKYLMEG